MQEFISSLNWFDISLISIVFISTVFALFRGLIKAIFSLVTWVSSSGIAVFLYPHSHPYIATHIHNEKLAIALASLGVFLTVFIILAIINSKIIFALRKITGGFFDRVLGLCFGAARGVLIVCLIFFSISLTSKMLHLGSNPERPGPAWFATAGTYEMLEMATTTMVSFAPAGMPDKLEVTVNKFKDITLNAIGEDIESSPSTAKTLSEDERQIMKQVISALPQEDLAEIYKKLDGNTASLSEFERIAIFKEILTTYHSYAKEGKIPVNKIIPDEKIKALDKSLNQEKASEDTGAGEAASETGYKEGNIKQMDRLIEGVR